MKKSKPKISDKPRVSAKHSKNFYVVLTVITWFFLSAFTLLHSAALIPNAIYNMVTLWMGTHIVTRYIMVAFYTWALIIYMKPEKSRRWYMFSYMFAWYKLLTASIYAFTGLGGGTLARNIFYLSERIISTVGLIGLTIACSLFPFRRRVLLVCKRVGNTVKYLSDCGFDYLNSIGLNVPGTKADTEGSLPSANQRNPWVAFKKPSTFQALITDKTFMRDRELLPIGVCVDSNSSNEGKHIFTSLKETSHLLVAGMTNSGKTVFLRSVVAGLAAKNTPEQVQFILIDAKRHGLKPLAGLEHNQYHNHVLHQDEEVAGALGDVLSELEDRILADRINPEPRIFVVIDEFDQFLGKKKSKKKEDDETITEMLIRIVKMGREMGIHLICGSQSPSGDLVSRHILTNMSRVCLKVELPKYSENIIQVGDGARLKGFGELLFYKSGELTKVQGYLITNEDMQDVVGEVVDHTQELTKFDNFEVCETASHSTAHSHSGNIVEMGLYAGRTASHTHAHSHTHSDALPAQPEIAATSHTRTDAQRAKIKELLISGESLRDISSALDVTVYQVRKVKEAEGL